MVKVSVTIAVTVAVVVTVVVTVVVKVSVAIAVTVVVTVVHRRFQAGNDDKTRQDKTRPAALTEWRQSFAAMV